MKNICIKNIYWILLLGCSVSLLAQAESDTSRKVNLAAIPIVNYSTTLGFTMGALGQIFYYLDPTDSISPSSSTGVFGLYTTNHTYFTAAFQRSYIHEDTWRIIFAAGVGNINFQYWQDLGFLGSTFIGFDTRAKHLP